MIVCVLIHNKRNREKQNDGVYILYQNFNDLSLSITAKASQSFIYRNHIVTSPDSKMQLIQKLF